MYAICCLCAVMRDTTGKTKKYTQTQHIHMCTVTAAVWTGQLCFSFNNRLVGLVVKASVSRAGEPGFESCLRQDFFGVESYQWLKNWHSSGYPARRLALKGQCWDCSAHCQYIVTGWDGKFGRQLLPQCGSTKNCLSRSIPEIHLHVAGTLSNQQTTTNNFFNTTWHPSTLPFLSQVPLRLPAKITFQMTNTNQNKLPQNNQLFSLSLALVHKNVC